MSTIGITASNGNGGCVRCGGLKRWSRHYGPPDDPYADFLCPNCDPPVGFVEVLDVRDHSVSMEEFERELDHRNQQ